MPLDANLNGAYFMKNRDRLLKLIKFLKENLNVTDANVGLRSTQEKITRDGLGLRNTYAVSAMASLSPFIASMGGVDYFRTASLEMIAGHRALALYIIHYLKHVPEVQGKCPYFKCSLITSEKVYRSIFQVKENEKVSKEEITATQHALQSKNYCSDYFDLKKLPADSTLSKEDVLNRVQEFIQQQISFDKNKKTKKKLLKRTDVKTQEKDDAEAQKHEGKDQDAALRQLENFVDRTPAPTLDEGDAPARNEEDAPAQNERDATGDQARQVEEGKEETALSQPKEAVNEAPESILEGVQEQTIRATAQARKKEERTLSDRPACKEDLAVQSQCQAQKALERQSAPCTNKLASQTPRRSTRKIKALDRLNL